MSKTKPVSQKLFSRIMAGTLLFACVGLLLLTSCGRKQDFYRAQFYDLFDTLIYVIGSDESSEAFEKRAQRVKQDLEEYHKLYDYYEHYDGYVNIFDLNQMAGRGPVKLDKRIIDLLDFSRQMYELSNGRVNIAMGSVLKIWHDYRSEGNKFPDRARLPELSALQEAARHCDINDLIIDRENSTAELRDPEMQLDVGAIAKGYATERIAELAEKRGEKHLLLSVGGNVRAIGSRDAQGSPWRVGVENPEPEKREAKPNLAVVGLIEGSLVTSGLYERFYIVNGQRYHHIIDPDTLFPEERFLQVSIYTKDSGLADALSTALFNSSFEDGLAIINKIPDTEAMWVLPDGSIKTSPGFAAHELAD